MSDKAQMEKTEAEWKTELSEEQFRICRKKGTERAFTGAFWDHHDSGVYCCVCCGAGLFSSNDKFDSGTDRQAQLHQLRGALIQTGQGFSRLMIHNVWHVSDWQGQR